MSLHPPQHFVLTALALLFGVTGGATARADTFSYDAAGRLQSATQANGLTQGYSLDEEGNLFSVNLVSTDTTDSGGPGNGIPDWWEYLYFGTRGVDPKASPANDGISNLMKYALGMNPLLSVSAQPLTLSFQSFTDGQTYPYLAFTRLKDAASILSVECSTDLVSWQTTPSIYAQVSVSDLGDGTEYVVLRNLTTLDTTPRVFFRLRATTP